MYIYFSPVTETCLKLLFPHPVQHVVHQASAVEPVVFERCGFCSVLFVFVFVLFFGDCMASSRVGVINVFWMDLASSRCFFLTLLGGISYLVDCPLYPPSRSSFLPYSSPHHHGFFVSV